MMANVVWMLLKAIAGLLSVACLLRAYLQWLRVSPSNPLSQLCLRLTNWLVIPLRRVIPPLGGLDAASLFAAFLIALAAASVKWALFSVPIGSMVDTTASAIPSPIAWLLLAVAWTLGWWLRFLVLLVIANVLMSWFGASPAAAQIRPVLAAMAEPFMGPVRNLLHRGRPSGLDFSPLLVFFVLQVMLSVHEQFEQALSMAMLGGVS